VCGSCRPLLAELAGAASPDPVKGWSTLAGLSLLGLLAALAVLLAPAVPYNASVADAIAWDRLWRDGLLKQISGFTLLGLALLVSVLSLRKRLPGFALGGFDLWRLAHVGLGVAAVLVLVAHTGLRLGHNLNLYLMLTFCGLLLAGALGGAVIALEHRLPRSLARRGRRLSIWAHILLIWPLPVLLGFHVLKGYWF
jgi:nitrite reductase (NADH) large subunit